MRIMGRVINPYKCPKCNQDMLFFLTNRNTLIDYKRLIHSGKSLEEIKKDLEDKHIRYLKCLACGKIFIMDWTSKFPLPLTDKDALNKFRV